MTLAVILVYLTILLGVGLYKSLKVKTEADFAVAGRTLPAWILTGTMLATWIGTGSILGNAGKTYEIGLAAFMLPLGSFLGLLLLVKLAPKVRDLKVFTVPEIMGNRYGQTTRILTVIALVLAYLVIVSYQYNAGGAVLQTILVDGSGEPLLSETAAVLIAAAFIILYTLLAGLISVAYTDVGNGIIILFSLLLALPIMWFEVGGWSGLKVFYTLQGKSEHLQFWGVLGWVSLINFCLPPLLLILGDANLYQRFSAAKDSQAAKRATIWLIFAVVTVELLIIGLAFLSTALVPEAEHGKYILIYAAHHFLPPLLSAVLMTTVVGIIISTADSYLLVPATTLIRDVVTPRLSKKVTQKKIVFLSRLAVLSLGVVAYFISRGFAQSAGFFERALYAYTIYGTAITPALVAALFWKGATKQGAIASIIGGTLTTLLWKETPFIQSVFPFLTGFDEVLPAISVSVICLIGFSWIPTGLREPQKNNEVKSNT
jgi:solute:Na+ symporter, SSS family